MTTKILWLEAGHAVTSSFVPGLRTKGYQVECVSTCKAAMTRLDTFSPSLAVVHAASFRSNGKRTCRTLRERLNGHPILLIWEQKQVSGEIDANQVLVLPFTLRKLLNRLRALVPEQEGKALHLGLLTLYPGCHLLQVNGHDPQSLTPTLISLYARSCSVSGRCGRGRISSGKSGRPITWATLAR